MISSGEGSLESQFAKTVEKKYGLQQNFVAIVFSQQA
jgi:hypothetical protein